MAKDSRLARDLVVPTISVIIPMYNAEEYVGECLDSLLAQTFQDFEIIVVDDCSADKCFELVEGYLPKFAGRLRLEKTEKNSGGGGYVPRNIGMSLARGEYVYFLDADDYIAKNALETFYNAAKEYDADVVYTSAHYDLTSPDEMRVLRDKENRQLLKNNVKDTPLLTIDDPQKNIDRLLDIGNFKTPWTKFLRRDFLIENEITFPTIVVGGDFIWGIHVYCRAKRFLRIQEPLYYYRRYSSASISTKNRNSPEQVCYVVSAFLALIKALTELANRTEILRQNLYRCYQALEGDFNYRMTLLNEVRRQLTSQEIYELLSREFNKAGDSASLLVPFFFSMINAERKARAERLQVIGNLKAEIKRLKGKGVIK